MTPKTIALVQQLEEISVWSLDRCCMDVHLLRRTAATAAKALSQERTCSTCRHMFIYAGLIDVDEQVPTCSHPHSPVRDYGDVSIEQFGCLLWEQADPKEPA
jgi:hypothetical protein